MTDTNNKRFTCLPYNDGTMITAQVLSFIALILSWNIASALVGLLAFVFLQLVWCCRMGKCGLITVGLLAMLASVVDIAIAGTIFYEGSTSICKSSKNIADEALNNAKDSSDDFISLPSSKDINNWLDQYCGPSVNTWAGVSLAAGILWLIVTFLIFYFSCGSRFSKLNSNNPGDKVVEEGIEVAVVMDESERRAYLGSSRTITGVVTGDQIDVV